MVTWMYCVLKLPPLVVGHSCNVHVHVACLAGQQVCPECKKVFKRKIYLQRHLEREHWSTAKVFKCDDCNYETKHQSNLSVHRRTHTGTYPVSTSTPCILTGSDRLPIRAHHVFIRYWDEDAVQVRTLPVRVRHAYI